MLKILLIKDLKILCKNLNHILFSLLLYAILILSYPMIFANNRSIDPAIIPYVVSLISFVIQSFSIRLENDADYQGNIIGYIYKLNSSLFTFILGKYLILLVLAAMHVVFLWFLLLTMIPAAPALILALAMFLFMAICAIMLLFANNLMVNKDTGYFALIILPFIVPYMMLVLSAYDNWHYLLIMYGILLIKAPIVLLLIAIMLSRKITYGK